MIMNFYIFLKCNIAMNMAMDVAFNITKVMQYNIYVIEYSIAKIKNQN